MMWLVTGVLLLLSGYVIVLNWWCAIRGFKGRSTSSWIPLVGGVLGALACIIAPHAALQQFWWVPLIADFGSIPGLGLTLFQQMFSKPE